MDNPAWLYELCAALGKVSRVLCDAGRDGVPLVDRHLDLRDALIELSGIASSWIFAVDRTEKVP